MHIQIVAGNDQGGAMKQLRQLKELADCLGETTKTVDAEAYSAAGLVEILELRGVSARETLVLDCSREQIQAVLERQSATDEVIEFEDLVLHLVKKGQPITAGAGR